MSWLLDTFVSLWLRRLRYPWSRLRRALFERKHAKVELPATRSPEEIASVLDQVTWTMDGPTHLWDAISHPQTTWGKKSDDCDGFAVLASELLRRWDPDTEPALLTMMLRPVKEGHTVCGFRHDAAWRYFDNDKLKDGPFASLAEIAAAVSRRGNSTVCWDVADPRSLQTLEFHRGGA